MKLINWLGIILLALFVIWLFIPLDEVGQNSEDNLTSIYENEEEIVEQPLYLYWRSLPIHYFFSENYPCVDYRKNNIEESFNIIEEKTDKIVTFYEEKSEYAIEIKCYDEYETEEASAYGGIDYYEGDKEILDGFVEFYKEDSKNFETCYSYPSVELHEILHAFGFDHIEDRKSIMSPFDDCTELDPEIIDCLKHIYSKGQGNYTCKNIPFVY